MAASIATASLPTPADGAVPNPLDMLPSYFQGTLHFDASYSGYTDAKGNVYQPWHIDITFSQLKFHGPHLTFKGEHGEGDALYPLVSGTVAATATPEVEKVKGFGTCTMTARAEHVVTGLSEIRLTVRRVGLYPPPKETLAFPSATVTLQYTEVVKNSCSPGNPSRSEEGQTWALEPVQGPSRGRLSGLKLARAVQQIPANPVSFTGPQTWTRQGSLSAS